MFYSKLDTATVTFSNKKDVCDFISNLQEKLRFHGAQKKTSILKEIFAQAALGCSCNGLLSKLPVKIDITREVSEKFNHSINKLDQRKIPTKSHPLMLTARQVQTYNTIHRSDGPCYPEQLDGSTNYWYLMQDGWKEWKDMDFTKSACEMDIYRVAVEHIRAPNALGFGNTTRCIWDSTISTWENELQEDKLMKKYGSLPGRAA